MIATTQTMKEVFYSINNEDDFSYAIRDFVDRFGEDPKYALIKEEPELLESTLNDSGVADAWIAATAVHLAKKYNIELPVWTKGNARALKKPWFGAKSEKLKTVLLQESPAAFRVRNLFVSANVLSRA
jgi:hypothetical protein